MTEMYKVKEDNKLMFLESELVNTGGNCMVLVVSYYDTVNKRTLFISTSDECTNIAIADTIRNDLDSALFDEMIIDSVYNVHKADWYQSDYAYYIDKQIFEYDKQCAKYFKHVSIDYPIDNAPTEVLIKAEAVGPKYLQWLDDNGQNITVIAKSDLIDVSTAYTNWLMNNTDQTKATYQVLIDDIKDFQQYFRGDYPVDLPGETTQEYDKRLDAWCNNRHVVVSYGNKSISIPICAAVYNSLDTFCTEALEDLES